MANNYGNNELKAAGDKQLSRLFLFHEFLSARITQKHLRNVKHLLPYITGEIFRLLAVRVYTHGLTDVPAQMSFLMVEGVLKLGCC